MPEQSPIPTRFADVARAVLDRRRLPTATYRVQLGEHLGFVQVGEIADYLDALGISDVYLSPCLKAGRGSTHGYDICDHRVLNPVLGSEADFDALADELRRRGMGLIFDLVPNHMGIADPDNLWWTDVLENGPSSPYAGYFDIDWHPLKAEVQAENRILLPVLADAYGKALESGEIHLGYDRGAFFVTCYDRRMPITPRQYADILTEPLASLSNSLGADHSDVLELWSIVTAIGHLPLETDVEPEKIAERQREKEIIKRRLDSLTSSSAPVGEAIDVAVTAFNGKRGDPSSFDRLHGLLDNQCYRLSYWRVAAEEINYRRFFDINDLAAIRMERADVFEETHRLVLGLLRDGKITGLRIDHADGLWDPAGYLRKLQRSAFCSLVQGIFDGESGGDGVVEEVECQGLADQYDATVAQNPADPIARSCWIVVEKILAPREELAKVWPIHGTTGYDFSNAVNRLFVDAGSRKAFTDLYSWFTRTQPTSFRDLVNSTKKIIMLVSLSSEINELAYALKRIAWKNRWYRDFTLNSLTHAIREIIAAFSVYRTYLTGDGGPIEAHELEAIDQAVLEAMRRNPRTAPAVFEFVRSVLLQQLPETADESDRDEWRNFSLRFQQTTSPVMAKGVEDTAFYVYNRLLSLNDVGGDPEQFGISVTDFHRQNVDRNAHWPYGLLATSTHDSKRSADVRARLDVLSEMTRAWRAALVRWSRANRTKKSILHGQPAPDRNDEYFLYQTLLGAWPLDDLDAAGLETFRGRIKTYMQKATKEAKVHGGWANPNQPYDDAMNQFVDRILTGRSGEGFLADFRRFSGVVAFFGMINSLSMRLLHLTSPGVPDTYQGDELWNFTLVDPDNRQPVDFARRTQLLAELVERVGEIEGESPRGQAERVGQRIVRTTDQLTVSTAAGLVELASELLESWQDGRIKLYLTHRALGQRRDHPDVFMNGDYRALDTTGTKRDHLVAFARSGGGVEFVTIVPRLVVGLTGESTMLPLGERVWSDTVVEIPERSAGDRYENVLTKETVTAVERHGRVVLAASDVFTVSPVALLRHVRSPLVS